MTQYTEPLSFATLSACGILAQLVAPVPDDLKTWPVTAILGLLLLSMLGVVAWQNHMSSKASIEASKASVEAAKAIQAITDAQAQNNTALKEVAADLRANTAQASKLVTTLENRPCLATR